MLTIFLILVGLVFGRLWFGVIALPILYGIPRTLYHISQGTLRLRAVVVYIAPVVMWSIVFAVLGVIVSLFGLRDSLYNSRDFFIGQLVGVFYGVWQALTKQGRRDLTADFWDAVNPDASFLSR